MLFSATVRTKENHKNFIDLYSFHSKAYSLSHIFDARVRGGKGRQSF